MPVSVDGESSAELQRQLDTVRAGVQAGTIPPEALPPYLEHELQAHIEKAKRQEARPASSRIPANASPPREVLRAVIKLIPMDEEEIQEARQLPNMQVTRFLQDRTMKQFLGFNGGNASTGQSSKVCVLPWKKEMGQWPPDWWAWMFALLFRRVGWCPGSVSLSYKMQDKPPQHPTEFSDKVDEAFADISRTDMFRSERWYESGVLFYQGLANADVDRENDISLAFDDARTLEWAKELGFELEDRSEHPARAFLVGDSDIVIIDCNGKHHKGHKAYVDYRLASAKRSKELDLEEADRRKAFLWQVLSSQALGETKALDNGAFWDKYTEFTAAKNKTIRRAAKQASIPVAQHMAGAACVVCGLREGTASEKHKNGIFLKLQKCPCRDPGALYCGTECQRAHWKSHRDQCSVHLQKKAERQAEC